MVFSAMKVWGKDFFLTNHRYENLVGNHLGIKIKGTIANLKPTTPEQISARDKGNN